jgi:ABC-type lipoprotein release transport system permease subunit
LKINDKSKSVLTAIHIDDKITEFFSSCNCRVIQGSGTNNLLQSVLTKIVDQLFVFNAILDIIIIIRVFQGLFWIAREYEYDINELKILGASKRNIYILFYLISIIIGNFGVILGVIGAIIIPTLLTWIIAIVSLQPVSIFAPSIVQIIENIIQINLIILLSTIVPASNLSSKKILKQKNRE